MRKDTKTIKKFKKKLQFGGGGGGKMTSWTLGKVNGCKQQWRKVLKLEIFLACAI
jgi:hypothetical protein